MKALNPLAVKQELTKTEASFTEATLDRVQAIIRPYITDAALESVNQALSRLRRKALTLDTISKIAYVHARSIRENNGASPYARIKAYLLANEIEIDNLSIKAATDILLSIEFLTLVDGEASKGKCRVYSLAKEAENAIYKKMTYDSPP